MKREALFRQIPDGEFRKLAREFLDRHHPALSIPVPIELIVEDSLGLRLLPVPDLFKRRKIWGYFNADTKGITHDAMLIHGDSRARLPVKSAVSTATPKARRSWMNCPAS